MSDRKGTKVYVTEAQMTRLRSMGTVISEPGLFPGRQGLINALALAQGLSLADGPFQVDMETGEFFTTKVKKP